MHVSHANKSRIQTFKQGKREDFTRKHTHEQSVHSSWYVQPTEPPDFHPMGMHTTYDACLR